MEQRKPKILMIGALPPPAIGPYLAMQRLLGSPVLNEAFTIEFLDLSDRRAPTNIGRFDWLNLLLGLKHAFQCLSRLVFHRPDIVYLGISQGTWGYLRDLTFIVPALCLRRRLVLHLRGSEFRSFYDEMPGWLRWLTRIVLSRTARIIVLGNGLKQVFAGLADPEKIVVIPNGIAHEEFAPRPEEARSFGKRILFLSSLRKRKGLFLLLEALPAVFQRHPDATMTIAGLWQDYAEQIEGESLIVRLGLQNKLTFVGEVTGAEKIHLFHTHDVFAFTPVEPEGLPWVILEAMSAALPVVTTNQGAIAEVVEPDKSGFIVPPAPSAVANRITFLLDEPATARAMGDHGRQRVVAHFSESAYFQKILGVFRQVMGSVSSSVELTVSPTSPVHSSPRLK